MYVFLDTNIFIEYKYNFNEFRLNKIATYLENGFLKLIVNSVLKGEVNKHIEDDIGKSVRDFNKALKFYGNYLINEKSEMNNILDEKEEIDKVKRSFNKFLSSANIVNVSVNVNVEKLIKDFFARNLPFASGKPNEFKDAIMIMSLVEFSKKQKEIIYVVSQDEGVRKSIEGFEGFKVFDNLNDFLVECDEAAAKVNLILKQRRDEFLCIIEKNIQGGIYTELIENYIANMDLMIDTYDECEDSSFSIEDIHYELSYTSLEETRAISYFIVEVDIAVEATYTDLDRSFYDKEDDTFSFVSQYSTNEKHKVEIEVPIAFDITVKDGNIEKILPQIIFKERYPSLRLSEGTCISKEIVYNSDTDDPDNTYNH